VRLSAVRLRLCLQRRHQYDRFNHRAILQGAADGPNDEAVTLASILNHAFCFLRFVLAVASTMHCKSVSALLLLGVAVAAAAAAPLTVGAALSSRSDVQHFWQSLSLVRSLPLYIGHHLSDLQAALLADALRVQACHHR
jgi:hypothetical protein